MGVPSFYRWLIERYPLILQDVIEEEPLEVNGVTIPVDTSKTNPNGFEYDNLYLDMNGIIHPCFHPEDKPSPTTFDEVFQCMFDYIDRLFVMIRPRKLLFLAIDGVAPRAKMNQQRSRRFRAAKDAAEAAAEEKQLREEFAREGKRLPPKVDSQVFDSNVITPGTEFMSTLSSALRYYIHVKLNSDPGWKDVKVILSDANVPGEGEHKIMSYIRHNKNHPGYDPNTHHCLYGLDADLIMLALATHEVHISILREVVFTPGEKDKCFLCGQMGHRAADCEGKMKRKAGDMLDKTETNVVVKKPYQLVNIWILREYLEQDMQIPNSRSRRILDRIIDDFIFICFFVGNDFLPHMPTLEIREGAIELLMSVYKKEFGSKDIYLTNESKLNLRNVEHFIQAVGIYENNIFLKRAQSHLRQSERFSRDQAQANTKFSGKLMQLDSPVEESGPLHSSPPPKFMRLSLDDNIGVASVETDNSIKSEELDNGEDLKFKLKKLLRDKGDMFTSGNEEEDKVKLGVSGWRERYYEEKFTAKSVEEMEQIRRDVVLKYTEGLSWIMHYYYHGVCSWNWFYPYHYAPFASDLKCLDKLDIKFELGSPFKPFNQLLAVLPSASSHALPECYRTLMTDPDSPIADFYPCDFEIDMNGKRFSWQGISKLPFIEESRLLDAAARVEHSLTTKEIRRNSVLFDMLFVVASHPLAKLIRSLNSRAIKLSNEERATLTEKIDPGLSAGMSGYIASCGEDSQPPCFSSPIEGMEDVLLNQVICAIYKLPDDIRGSNITHQAPGVVIPKKTVQLVDLKGGGNLWHEDGEKKRGQGSGRIIKINRFNPVGAISGHRLGKAAHSLVLQTLNAQPDNTQINSEPALCLNAVFQNQRQPRKAPSFQDNEIKWITPPIKMTCTEKESPQSETPQSETPQSETPQSETPLRTIKSTWFQIPVRKKIKKNYQSDSALRKKKGNKGSQRELTREENRKRHDRMAAASKKRKDAEMLELEKSSQSKLTPGKKENKGSQRELTKDENRTRHERMVAAAKKRKDAKKLELEKSSQSKPTPGKKENEGSQSKLTPGKKKNKEPERKLTPWKKVNKNPNFTQGKREATGPQRKLTKEESRRRHIREVAEAKKRKDAKKLKFEKRNQAKLLHKASLLASTT